MQEIRKRKVESLLREVISTILVNDEIKDPRLNKLVTVTDVGVSNDLKAAKVYISVLGSKNAQRTALAALNHAAGFIQKLIGPRIRLRYTPRIEFFYDASLEKGFRLDQQMKDLAT